MIKLVPCENGVFISQEQKVCWLYPRCIFNLSDRSIPLPGNPFRTEERFRLLYTVSLLAYHATGYYVMACLLDACQSYRRTPYATLTYYLVPYLYVLQRNARYSKGRFEKI